MTPFEVATAARNQVANVGKTAFAILEQALPRVGVLPIEVAGHASHRALEGGMAWHVANSFAVHPNRAPVAQSFEVLCAGSRHHAPLPAVKS